MDCREVVRDGRPGVEFSWEGNDECDPASGRGWAVLEENGSLRGRIFFHFGDDSGYTAVRGGEPTRVRVRSGHWPPNPDAGALTGYMTGKANIRLWLSPTSKMPKPHLLPSDTCSER